MPEAGSWRPAPGPGVVVDWGALRQAAAAAARRAYAPYSGLRVGAAGVCRDAGVVTGCNVENASFGLTLCAECGLVSALVAGGGGPLVAVSVTTEDGRPLAPCGRCRQLLMEHGGPDLLLDCGGAVPQRLSELLPGAFDGAELAARRQPPLAPGPATPGPSTPAPATPGPATPGPATPGPAGPQS